ncbi:MAG: septal ring lytic transglycosylase RlpA family protein [Proteobacteria bacterium]|nr:septal ring lytic transglycosylase RlpA family protein [Pseudomonadota bacterium]
MLKLNQLLTVSLVSIALILSGCGSHGPHKPTVWKRAKKENKETPDGPPEMDMDVSHIPNAIPMIEPLSRYGNPAKYEVFGVHYHTMPHSHGYSAEGTASWYGRKFHGQRTSSGEPYDMFGMTAAHRSLPLPTYAKVKNLVNGKEVIVKINDRGPFVKDRLIDLSYAAAKKLGIHAKGTGKVLITAIDPAAWHKQQKEHLKLAQKSNAGSTKQQKSTTTTTKATQAKNKSKEQPTQNKKSTQLAQANTPKSQKAKAKLASTESKKPPTNTKGQASDKKNTQLAKANKQLYLQLGSFSKETNAQQLAKRATTLTQALDQVGVKVVTGKLANKESFRVRIGPLKNEQQAENLKKKLVALNAGDQAKLIYEN